MRIKFFLWQVKKYQKQSIVHSIFEIEFHFMKMQCQSHHYSGLPEQITSRRKTHTHTHKHSYIVTHMYMYILYVHMYKYVCVSVQYTYTHIYVYIYKYKTTMKNMFSDFAVNLSLCDKFKLHIEIQWSVQ